MVKEYHAIIVPFPAQGHVNPCMQLANKLVGQGFRITFVHFSHTRKRILKSNVPTTPVSTASSCDEPDIEFVEVSDGLPDDYTRRLDDIPAYCMSLVEMAPVFEDLLRRLSSESRITCVVADIAIPTIIGSALKVGIPTAAFATLSTISFHCSSYAQTFIDAGVLPLPCDPSHPCFDPKNLCVQPVKSDVAARALKAPLPSSFPGASRDMRVRDLPTTLLVPEFIHIITDYRNPVIPACACLLLNSFYDLEADTIDATKGHANDNIYPIGPLVYAQTGSSAEGDEEENPQLVLAGVKSPFWEEDSKALVWLNSKSPRSLLYVSFGSIAQISTAQVLEIADGLEQSQRSFLWVMRPDLADENLITNSEFSQFLERTSRRALVVPWVPQTAVLSHPSIGAFLTHCGWNSVIESISCGIPMLGWPFLSDQTTNCFYVANVWRIGLAVEFSQGKKCLVGKEEVGKKVRMIMAKEGEDEYAEEMESIRERSRQMKARASNSVKKGGSSHKALLDFVRHVTSY